MIPTTGRDDDAGPDSFRTTVCPNCGSPGPRCAILRSLRSAPDARPRPRRRHQDPRSFRVPRQGVLHLAVVSSLFPQLAGASRSAYRVAFGLIVVLLVGLAVVGLTAPVIAVSALAVPLLFLIYLYEIAPREARFAVPTVVIFGAGAALGVVWALLLGPVVSDSLVGYMPGYGEAFQTIAISADGNPVKFEVGPQVDLNTIVNHPTEAKLALALWADPDLNGVRWKGESLP